MWAAPLPPPTSPTPKPEWSGVSILYQRAARRDGLRVKVTLRPQQKRQGDATQDFAPSLPSHALCASRGGSPCGRRGWQKCTRRRWTRTGRASSSGRPLPARRAGQTSASRRRSTSRSAASKRGKRGGDQAHTRNLLSTCFSPACLPRSKPASPIQGCWYCWY